MANNYKSFFIHLRCVIMFCFFCITFNSVGQFNATYLFYVNNSISGIIELNDKSNYEINIIFSQSEDTSMELLLSRGKYTLSNGELIFLDTFNKYSQRFKINIDRDKIIAISSFKWMQNLPINKFKSYSNIEKTSLNSDVTINRIRRINKTIGNFTLYFSTYSDFIFKDGKIVSLIFDKPNKYKLQYLGFVLSEGLFVKKGNEIILHDNSLNHNFYCFLSKENLNCFFTENSIVLKTNK